jgi:multiple sugar transport system substrate-binding protein
MLTMPESLGGKAISDDGLSVKGLLTDSAWKQSCQFISDLFNVDKVAPKGVSASDMLAYFPSGKLAMLIGPDYNIRAYSQLKDLHWDYAPYPYFKNGKPVTPTGSWSLGINKYSKNKQAAMKLIKFLTLTPACVDWFYMDGHLPTNKNTFTAIDNDSKFKEWPFNVFDLLTYESNNTAVPRPMTPGYLEYESILTNAFDDIRNGADIDTTLSNTEDQIDRSLAKYR